jgi:hypothetical protein
MTNDQVANELIQKASEMYDLLTKVVKFDESAQVGKVRVMTQSVVALMQGKGILPKEFHMSDGTMVHHLSAEDDDPKNTHFEWIQRVNHNCI